jgi:hypothetical protein
LSGIQEFHECGSVIYKERRSEGVQTEKEEDEKTFFDLQTTSRKKCVLVHQEMHKHLTNNTKGRAKMSGRNKAKMR